MSILFNDIYDHGDSDGNILDAFKKPKSFPKTKPKKKKIRKRKTKCPDICNQRVDELSTPRLVLVEATLASYHKTLEPKRIVRLVRLIHEINEPKPHRTFNTHRKIRNKNLNKIKGCGRKTCEMLWLKLNAKKTAQLIVSYLQNKTKYVPNYKQLQVAMHLRKKLNYKKIRDISRLTKLELDQICQQLAITCDTKFEPYKRSVRIDSAESTTTITEDEKKHCIFSMKSFVDECVESEEEEEEECEEAEGEGEEFEGEGEEEEGEELESVGEGEEDDLKAESDLELDNESTFEEEAAGRTDSDVKGSEFGSREGGQFKERGEFEEERFGQGGEFRDEGRLEEREEVGQEGRFRESGELGERAVFGEGGEINQGGQFGEGGQIREEGRFGEEQLGEGRQSGERDGKVFGWGEHDQSSGQGIDQSNEISQGIDQVSGIDQGPGGEKLGEDVPGGKVEDASLASNEAGAGARGFGEYDYGEGDEANAFGEAGMGEEEIAEWEKAMEEIIEGLAEECLTEESDESVSLYGEDEEARIIRKERKEIKEKKRQKEKKERLEKERLLAHPEGTATYVSWSMYSSWLNEFEKNINMYTNCLHQFGQILRDGEYGKYHEVVNKILNDWSKYLSDTKRVDQNMINYFKNKPITRCVTCTDYDLNDIPKDHEIPPVLLEAVNTTKTWKKLLEDLVEFCKILGKPRLAEIKEEDEFTSSETIDICDMRRSSSSSGFVVEDRG